jgi:hypothetical protein
MYQPSHATTEFERMRAEEMRARAERYRRIQKAKQHKKTDSEDEEAPSRSRIFVYRKALGIVGLSLVMILGFVATALAMPADAPPGVGGSEETCGPTTTSCAAQALVSQPQVREGPPSFWEAQSAAVAEAFGGQERAALQHVGEAEPGAVAEAFGGQERAAIQHIGQADQPPTFNPAPGLTPSSGGIELELVLFLAGITALASLGALVWFRRHTMHTA